MLDDSRRFVERAVAAGVDTRVDIWEGMPHGFYLNLNTWNAASHAMAAIGVFLAEQLSE